MNFLKISIILIVLLVLFLSRQIFFYQYDPEYQEDLYYHSQWNIPDSSRSISDGELYKFVGYRLVKGENPFNINYEVPPLAKYLYGAGSFLFGNPYLVSIAIYLGSIVTIYLILKELFKDKRAWLIGTLLFASTPFVASQVRETMLDLPLMFFMLVHTLFATKYFKSADLKYLLLSGIFIGLSSGAKLGVYTPLAVLSFELILIYQKGIKLALIYPLTVLAGYVGSYFMYFIQHQNPIPWIRLHEKTIDFYMSGGLPVTPLNQWKLIFLNQYQGWWDPGSVSSINDWTFLLPVGVVAAVIVCYKALKRRNITWVYLSTLAISILIVNTIIPIYPRYLMPLIPLFVIFAIKVFRKKAVLLLLLVALNIPIIFSSLYSYNPEGDIQTLSKFVSTRAYKEIYKMTTAESLNGMTIDEFAQVNEKFFGSIDTRKIEVRVKDHQVDKDTVVANLLYEYDTPHGMVHHTPAVEFKRIHNRWQLVWNWNYLWDGYSPDAEISVQRGTIPLSRIVDSNGRTLATRNDWKTVNIIPRVMNPWNEFLDKLATITLEDRNTINTRVRSVIPDHFPRFVGYLDLNLTLEEGDQLAREIPGATLEDISFVRILPAVDKAVLNDFLLRILSEQPELFYQRSQINIVNTSGDEIPITFSRPLAEDQIIEVY